MGLLYQPVLCAFCIVSHLICIATYGENAVIIVSIYRQGNSLLKTSKFHGKGRAHTRTQFSPMPRAPLESHTHTK